MKGDLSLTVACYDKKTAAGINLVSCHEEEKDSGKLFQNKLYLGKYKKMKTCPFSPSLPALFQPISYGKQ